MLKIGAYSLHRARERKVRVKSGGEKERITKERIMLNGGKRGNLTFL